jgi:hypothetical protein
MKSQFDIITDIRYTHKIPIYETNLEEKQESSSGNAQNEEENDRNAVTVLLLFREIPHRCRNSRRSFYCFCRSEMFKRKKKCRATNLKVVCLQRLRNLQVFLRIYEREKLFSCLNSTREIIFFLVRLSSPTRGKLIWIWKFSWKFFLFRESSVRLLSERERVVKGGANEIRSKESWKKNILRFLYGESFEGFRDVFGRLQTCFFEHSARKFLSKLPFY